MRLEVFDKYIAICKRNNVEPTWEGCNLYNKFEKELSDCIELNGPTSPITYNKAIKLDHQVQELLIQGRF